MGALALRCPPLACRPSPPQVGRSAVASSSTSQSPPLWGRLPAGQRGALQSAIPFLVLVVLSVITIFATTAHADEATLRPIIAKFASAKNFQATEAVARELVASGDPVVEKP